jgi:hypothetical protein
MLAITVLVVAGAVLSYLIWSLRRARASGVIADPHRPPMTLEQAVLGSTTAPARPAHAAQDVEAVRDYLLAKARVQTGIDLAHDALAKQRLAEAAALAVEQLRRRETAEINLPFLTADASGPKHLLVELHRAELEVLVGRRPS